MLAMGPVEAQAVTCRYCGRSYRAWATLKNGRKRRGVDLLRRHVEESHPEEYDRITARLVEEYGSDIWATAWDMADAQLWAVIDDAAAADLDADQEIIGEMQVEYARREALARRRDGRIYQRLCAYNAAQGRYETGAA